MVRIDRGEGTHQASPRCSLLSRPRGEELHRHDCSRPPAPTRTRACTAQASSSHRRRQRPLGRLRKITLQVRPLGLLSLSDLTSRSTGAGVGSSCSSSSTSSRCRSPPPPPSSHATDSNRYQRDDDYPCQHDEHNEEHGRAVPASAAPKPLVNYISDLQLAEWDAIQYKHTLERIKTHTLVLARRTRPNRPVCTRPRAAPIGPTPIQRIEPDILTPLPPASLTARSQVIDRGIT
jgi:hypothetical protein